VAGRPPRRGRVMASEAGEAHHSETTARGAGRCMNRAAGSQAMASTGDRRQSAWTVSCEGEQMQPQGVKAPRGRSASRGRKRPTPEAAPSGAALVEAKPETR
jgi:hypothetical protein